MKPRKELSRGPVKPRKRSESTHVPKTIRDAVLARDDWRCQRCGRDISNGLPYSLQHRRPRGMGGSKLLHTMANLVTLCGTATSPGHCHSAVEGDRGSKATGWLVPNGATPENWPVLRFGDWWEQPGDTWVRCEPHWRQVELLGDAA